MLPVPPLLVVSDRRQAVLPLPAVAGAVFAAGGRWFSLREKDLAPAAVVALARQLGALGRAAGAVVTLHGPAELAAAAGLAGVHLPAGAGADVAAARRLLGPGALVGQSAHGRAEAEAAAAAGADYVVLGPAFATPSKPGYGPALGPAGLAAAARTLAVPLVAIGGIEPPRVAECLGAGAAGIAVMGAVMRAADPGTVVAELLACLETGRAGA